MENKTLSIIIPSYNMENYLEKCLLSLVNHRMNQLDIIIVNDGSKDNTLSIAESWRKKYPESIRVIDKPNGNYGSCINAALGCCVGKYIKVLDADDTFITASLEKYIQFLDKTDVGLVISDYNIVNETGLTTKQIHFNLPHETDMKLNSFIDKMKSNEFEMHAVAYNRKVFDRLSYHQTEGISYTDQEWMFEPMVAVTDAIYYPHPIYSYLVGRAGQTVNPSVSKKMVEQTIIVVLSMLDTLKKYDNDISTELRNYFNQRIHIKIVSIYRILLLKSKRQEKNASLISLNDKLRREHRCLYESLGSEIIKILPFHYIPYWRRQLDKNGSFILLRLMQNIISLL